MFVHSSRVKKQIEYLQSKKINTKFIYKEAGFSEVEMLNPEKIFSLEQFQKVLKFGMTQTEDIFYGLHFGQEPQIGGTIGMFCASCKNLKEAFEQGCKYFKLQGDFAETVFIDDKNYPKITYKINDAWLLNDAVTAQQEVDAMFAFLSTILKVNSNNTLKPFRVNFAYEKSKSFVEYEKVFGISPYFNQERNEILFRAGDLNIPMKAFNPETFQLLKAHIENQLQKTNLKLPITKRVKSVLLSTVRYQFPDIENVASKLNISPRTLQRQLSNEKTSFKNILLETKFDLAKQLLGQNQLTISEISYTLGYSDLGNFSRSFKKFTGKSPMQFRNSN